MALTRLFVHDTFYDATDNFTYTPGMRLTLDNTTQSARIARLQASGVVSTDETIDPAGVAITGGSLTGVTVDNSVIGGTTPAAGDFTIMSAGNGSAAAPSITFTSDPDTGFYRSAANEIGVAVAGGIVALFDATGALVLGGGTSPGNATALFVDGGAGMAIEVNRSDDGQIIELDGNGYSTHVTMDGTGLKIGHGSAARDFQLQTNSTTAITIDASQNVGVGVTSMNADFVVSGTTLLGNATTDREGVFQVSQAVSGTIATSTGTDASQIAVIYGSNVGAAGAGTHFGSYAGTGASWIQSRAVADFSTTYDLLLQPGGGNVGIGVDGSPVNRLEVEDLNAFRVATLTAIAGGYSDFTASTNTAYSTLLLKGNNNGYAGLTIASPNSNNQTGAIAFADESSGSAGLIAYYHSNDRMDFWRAGASAMILIDGYVGFNSTSPATATGKGIDFHGAGGCSLRLDDTTNSVVAELQSFSGGVFVGAISNHPLVFFTNNTDAGRFDTARNLLIGGSSTPTSSVGNLVLFNGTAPTASVSNGVVLYAEDVTSSSELKVRDEAGNVTTLSPHNFENIPGGPSEDMAWSYNSERHGRRISVDMLKVVRLVESLADEQLVHLEAA